MVDVMSKFVKHVANLSRYSRAQINKRQTKLHMSSSIQGCTLPRRLHTCFSIKANFQQSADCSTPSAVDSTPSATGVNGRQRVDLITQHTEVTSDHLTPEVKLRLITKRCPLWHKSPDQCPFADPYWAFYWPGGQVLTRFILDNPDVVGGKNVLDVGSGCGASAIAAVSRGAGRVLANDIDPVAVEAIKLNAALNNVSVQTSTTDMIGQLDHDDSQWDVVFLGDMFYDRDFTIKVADWLKYLRTRHKCCILIGDPDRVYLKDHPLRKNLTRISEIELPPNCIEENRGHIMGYVWEFVWDP